MQERTIMKISVGCTVIGIVVLFFFLQFSEPQDVMIGNLDQAVDETVYVTGMIVDVNQMELDGGGHVTFIKLQKDELTTVTLFGPVPILDVGDYVQVKGSVSENDDGGVEVMGDEVRVV